MRFRESVVSALVSGLLAIVPIYIAALLLLKAIGSLMGLVRPIAGLLPEWLPAEQLLALLLMLGICLLVGYFVHTRIGGKFWGGIERPLEKKVPGYATIRSFTRQLAGESKSSAWKPALAEIEDALVPAFIIEVLDDGRSTVFVPSVPTPFAGCVYILTPDRVHPVDIPLTQAIKAISQWGAGSKTFVAAMKATNKRESSLEPAR